MKLKKKEEQSMNTLILTEKWTKHPWLTANQQSEHRVPNGAAGERTQGAEEIWSPAGGTIILVCGSSTHRTPSAAGAQ